MAGRPKEITDSAVGAGIFAQCDVSNEQRVEAAVKLAIDRWPKVDVLVNDAAMISFQNVVDLSVRNGTRHLQ